MKNIIISNGNTQTIAKKADLYIEVFGEAPRNEGYIDGDGNLYPLSYNGDVSGMSLFYDKEDLVSQRLNRTKKNGYIECIASVFKSEKLVGFTMGWSDTLLNLNKEKFDLGEQEYSLLLENITNILKNNSIDEYFYAADLGVNIEYRGLGIASQLYDARYKRILKNDSKVIIVRTTKNSQVPYERYKSKGFQEVYNYNDIQNRVIMILPINMVI